MSDQPDSPEPELYTVHLRVINKATGEVQLVRVDLTRTEVMELIAEGAVPSDEFLAQMEQMELAPGAGN